MFLCDEEIDKKYFDKPTAYYCGMIAGAAIGVIGTGIITILMLVLSSGSV